MKAGAATKGFVFVEIDNWYKKDNFYSPIVARLFEIIENGMEGTQFFDKAYHNYGGLYVNGNAKTIRFVYASPGKVTEILWETSLLARAAKASGSTRKRNDIFDDRWHYITIVFSQVNGRRQAQLYLDGESHFQQIGWIQCFPVEEDIAAIDPQQHFPLMPPFTTPTKSLSIPVQCYTLVI
jgi:hypothetical protein